MDVESNVDGSPTSLPRPLPTEPQPPIDTNGAVAAATTATATAAAAVGAAMTATASGENDTGTSSNSNSGSNSAPAPDLAAAPKTTTASAAAAFTSERFWYRILTLSIVATALICGSGGFALGVQYSNQTCSCCRSNSDGTNSSQSSTGTDSTSTNNTSNGSGSSNTNNSGDGSGAVETNDDVSFDEGSTVPPASFSQTTISCLDHDIALDELRTAIFTHAHIYIHRFGYYIRKGGNHSLHVDFRYNEPLKLYGWLLDDTNDGTNTSSNSNGTNASTTTTSTVNRSLRTTSTTRRDRTRLQNIPSPQRSLRQTSARAATVATTASTRHELMRQTNWGGDSGSTLGDKEKTARRRRAQSTSSTSSSGDSSSDKSSHVETADMVQSNGEYVFVAYNGNEIVVLHSVTSSIVERIRIPRRHSSSRIEGLLLVTQYDQYTTTDQQRRSDEQQVLEPLGEQYLVVLVQEEDYSDNENYYSSSPSNTTVLVYDIMDHEGNGADAGTTYSSDLTLVAQHSLAGRYSQAYTVHGTLQVHVVTTTSLDLDDLTAYLTPAYLQSYMNNATANTEPTSTSSISNSYSYGSSNDDSLPPPPPLLLNEAQYLELALAQLDMQLERFVSQQAALLDCTGFVPLANRPGRNGTNMILSEPNTFVNIVSLNVSTSMSTPQGTSGKSAMSVLPPGNSAASNLFVSDTKLVLICELWSGSNFTIASQPLSWLLSFDLPMASSTGMALTSVGIVHGVISSTDMNHVSTNGIDHLRVIAAQYSNLVDYYRYNGNTFPSQLQLVMLEMTDTTISTVANSINSEFIMPIIGEVSDFGINGSALAVIASVLFEEAVVHLGVVTATTPHDFKSILYTIDVTAPSNPRVVGQLEMANFSIRHLHAIRNEQNVDSSSNNDTLLLGVGVTVNPNNADGPQTPEELLHLVLVNVSTPDPQTSRYPAGSLASPRLIQQWRQEPPPVVPDINATTDSSESTTTTMFDYYDRDMSYIAESNIVVVPATIMNARSMPCPTDNEGGGSSWSIDDDFWSTTSTTNTSSEIEMCPYDQSIEFDGFWLFKVHLPETSTGTTANITRHFVIDHGLPALTPRPDCNQNGLPFTARSYVFDGDIMTIKGDSVLTFDLLTKTEAAPPVLLTSADCNA